MREPSHAEILRALYPRVLGKTLGLTRTLPDAEDAVQDALERALSTWHVRGTPESPEAWLVTVAANSHRDRLRRTRQIEPRANALEVLAQMTPWVAEPEPLRGWKDELLRLLFACCHPALEEGESAALALATVVGLSMNEIATAFVVAPRSMEQRLTRARQRLRELGDPEGASPWDSQERVAPVLRTIHLLFNEGYWSMRDEAPIRAELCQLAIGLAGSLLEAFPSVSEAAGLLALLLLHDARRGARSDPSGGPIPLPDQDRERWDHRAIAGATLLLEQTLAVGQPGPFQIEAAISAVHCRAGRAEDTDWREIAVLYLLLERLRPTPAVRVSRAFALARSNGPADGLALLDASDMLGTSNYPYVHLVRGTLLGELGRNDEATMELELAEGRARNAHERAQIQAKREALEEAGASSSPFGDHDR